MTTICAPAAASPREHRPRLAVGLGAEPVDDHPHLDALRELALEQRGHLRPDLALAPAEHEDVHRRARGLDVGEDAREEGRALDPGLDRRRRRPGEARAPRRAGARRASCGERLGRGLRARRRHRVGRGRPARPLARSRAPAGGRRTPAQPTPQSAAGAPLIARSRAGAPVSAHGGGRASPRAFAARCAFCSATLTLASVVGLLDEELAAAPSRTPRPRARRANAMFHAVIASCWPSEYAVAVAASVTSSSAATLVGLVDADAARRDRDRVGDRVAAHHRHHRVERDRDPVAGEEHGDHAELGQPGAERRQRDAHGVLARAGEDRAALLGLLPQARAACARRCAPSMTSRSTAPASDASVRTGWSCGSSSWRSNVPGTDSEQVDVDERAGDA